MANSQGSGQQDTAQTQLALPPNALAHLLKWISGEARMSDAPDLIPVFTRSLAWAFIGVHTYAPLP